MDKDPFDPVKASFLLIAAVLAAQCLIAVMGLVMCIYWSGHIAEGRFSCNNVGDGINQLLTGALAAALAFSGSFTKRDK